MKRELESYSISQDMIWIGYDMDMGTAISHKTVIIRKVFLEKKEPLLVARETNHSPEAVQRYCLHFNKVKWCVVN
jgi:hypothetical protein